MKRFFTILLVMFSFGMVAHAQVASNPPYTLEQAVIAGGGATSEGTSATGSPLTLTGTIGQPAAGTVARGGNRFRLVVGFFTSNPVQPTAATAVVAGQVTTARGIGLGGVSVTLTGGAHTDSPLVIYTDAEGNYLFPALATDETYVITLAHKRFAFAPATQFVDLTADVMTLNFTASSAKSRRRSLR